MTENKLVLIDGHSIINRAFYGMPDLTNVKGVHTGAVYGFLNILFRILDEEKASHLLVAFDTHAPTFRHKMYDKYKGTRKPMPEELRTQVPLLQNVLDAMGIARFSEAGLEADDILGTYARLAESRGFLVSLVSGDRDLLQIASDRVTIRIPKTIHGQTTIENYSAAGVKEKLGIEPWQVIEMKSLMGDTADNIPGVPKVGEKTAGELIKAYGSAEGVYDHLSEITRKSLHSTLEENRELCDLSHALATIKMDCAVPDDLEKLKIGNFYTPEAYSLFSELSFRNFLSRFDASAAGASTDKENEHSARNRKHITAESEAEDAFAVIRSCLKKGNINSPAAVGVYPLLLEHLNLLGEMKDTGEGQLSFFDAASVPVSGGNRDYVTRRMLGTAISAGRNVYVFETSDDGLSEEYLCRKLGKMAELVGKLSAEGGENALMCIPSLKQIYPYLGGNGGCRFGGEGIHLAGMVDLLLAAYLCNPLKNDYTLEDAAQEYLSSSPRSYSERFARLSPEEVYEERREELFEYAADMAEVLSDSAPKLCDRLRKEGMETLYRNIERPLTYVLYDMQRIGIRIDPAALREYSKFLGSEADRLQGEIFEETGEKFNISSPKQLGEILFEKMGIPGGKKTRTGYSTAADVLNRLAEDHPFVQKILDYRAVTKLKSTYADGLGEYICSDLRIHTTFNQTITATGRISSTDPNLQNIPMKTEMGRQIRKAFLPKEGYCFADADYSQIELRILASMSGDSELIEAYRQNSDIHRVTASKVFHVPFEEVTPLQRRNAKAVNFGIVYGISSFGLSQGLSISRAEAKEYIDAYFATYPGIRNYLDRCVADAKKKGAVYTLFGRKRPIPELSSSNFMQRQFGERIAMNSPIQGTAADIMKIAMIRVFERLKREKLSSELILQIHDELVIETAPGEEERVSRILEEEMKNAADLPVALIAEVHTGKDWYEAK